MRDRRVDIRAERCSFRDLISAAQRGTVSVGAFSCFGGPLCYDWYGTTGTFIGLVPFRRANGTRRRESTAARHSPPPRLPSRIARASSAVGRPFINAIKSYSIHVLDPSRAFEIPIRERPMNFRCFELEKCRSTFSTPFISVR
ncbi:unnamed protein product, partial [Iphiclides podalirius]